LPVFWFQCYPHARSLPREILPIILVVPVVRVFALSSKAGMDGPGVMRRAQLLITVVAYHEMPFEDYNRRHLVSRRSLIGG